MKRLISSSRGRSSMLSGEEALPWARRAAAKEIRSFIPAPSAMLQPINTQVNQFVHFMFNLESNSVGFRSIGERVQSIHSIK
jgi:hypothetical protein